MEEFLQHLINGIGLGSIYALIALGYTMVYGILKLINFAHSDVYMIGAYCGFYFARWYGLENSPSLKTFVTVLLSAMFSCAVLGATIERLAYRPLRSAPRINALITAIGVSLFLEYSGQIIFGATPQVFPNLLENSVLMSISDVNITSLDVTILITSLILMTILRYIILHTQLGRAMRATSFNHNWASLMGINVDRIITITFVIGSSLAAAGGILVGLKYPKIDPLMGVLMGLKAFVAAVLGGIGNIPGAVLGGLILALAEELVTALGGSTYRDALAFGILIIILLVKPTGLMGQKMTEKV